MEQLTDTERDIVSLIANQEISLKSELFLNLKVKSRANILETLMDYYEFRLVRESLKEREIITPEDASDPAWSPKYSNE